jgi:Flp pilus assembly protein TadG
MSQARSRRGSALIEFAASLVLLSLAFTGVFQAGFTFFAYNALVNSVRSGARYASLRPVGTDSHRDIVHAVRNLVVYGDPQPSKSAKALLKGLSTDQIQVILTPAAATVSVSGYEIDALFSKLKLEGRPTVTFPVVDGAAQ